MKFVTNATICLTIGQPFLVIEKHAKIVLSSIVTHLGRLFLNKIRKRSVRRPVCHSKTGFVGQDSC